MPKPPVWTNWAWENILGDQGRFFSLKGKLEFIESRRQAAYKVSIRTLLVQVGQKNWSQKWLKKNKRERERKCIGV